LVAFNAAGHALGVLGDELSRDPEASCPEGQFLSTWKYILNKGSFLQTTLTLAWLDGVGQVANLPAARQIGNLPHFHLAMIGDGGALWRGDAGPPGATRLSDRILAACNLDSQQVHALGPAERHVHDFDCWREEALDGPFLCALFTDGIGRGIGKRPLTLLDELDRLHAAGVKNSAQQYIEQAIRDHPKEFDDNLTLAVIRAEV